MAFSGFKVIGTREQPTLNQAGQPAVDVVIDLATDAGAIGQLRIPQRQYESLSDEELANLLVKKAAMLDRALFL